jgi:hypothetical protein
MQSLTEKTIRESFVNASRKEVTDATMPDLGDLPWQRLDYLGWRDRKLARRAYLVVDLENGPVGIVLQQAETSPRSRAQCSWCQDVTLPNDVVLFTARLAGAAGKKGNVVGTLICANFECSVNVRRLPPVAYIGFDVEAARENRIATLRERATSFAAGIAISS